MFKRSVKLSKNHSFFLFGPRATGKSTLLFETFPPVSNSGNNLWVNLLDYQVESLLRQNPERLEDMILKASQPAFVIIDEVQKNPRLLDVVHRLIFERKQKFILTGSSARKLKRGSANLLAGRAFNFSCHPLTHKEIGDKFYIDEVLSYGSLPEIFSLNEDDKKNYLRAYIGTYFKEEVVAEQLIRNLTPFRTFLEIASQSNTKIVSYSNIARNIEVDHTTVQNYFSILEDTLLGFLLPPFSNSFRKRQRTKSKFYYFDLGVQRVLSGQLEIPLKEGVYGYGEAFEQFVVLEFKRFIDYFRPDWRMSYFASSDNAEIDLVIERPGKKTAFIEIKSTRQTHKLEPGKLTAFKHLVKDYKNADGFLVSQDKIRRNEDGISFLPWVDIFEEFFDQ